MTRTEYLAAGREDGAAAHRTYYAQFVTDATRSLVRRTFGTAQLKAAFAVDPHFNSIALGHWDALTHQISSSTLAAKMRELGDYPTLAGLGCTLKEAARQIVEQEEG